jgi:sugar lactone lactonase YvrE
MFHIHFRKSLAASHTFFALVFATICSSCVALPMLWIDYAGESARSGFVDNQGSLARFSTPGGLDIDSSGNVYVADTHNHAIRKVAPDGSVITIAGHPSRPNLVDGSRGIAGFSYPTDVALAPDGSLYVLDGSQIRHVSVSGDVETFAGKPGGQSIEINQTRWALDVDFGTVYAIDVDSQGNVYAARSEHVLKIQPNGITTTFLSSYTDGADSPLGTPSDIVIGDNDTLYTISSNNYLKVVPASGSASELALQSGIGDFTRMTLTSSNRLVTYSHSLEAMVEISLNGSYSVRQQMLPSQPESYVPYQTPQGFTSTSDGVVIFSDSGSHSLQKLLPENTTEVLAGIGFTRGGDGNRQEAGFLEPDSLVSNGANELFFVDQDTIRKVNLSTGEFTTVWNSWTDPIELETTIGFPFIAADTSGNVYLPRYPRRAISKIDANGQLTTLAGAADQFGHADGLGNQARFGSIRGITQDAEGNLYVLQTQPIMCIRKISPEGLVSTLTVVEAGTSNPASFFALGDIAYHPDGSLLVTDGNKLRKVSPTGEVALITDGEQGSPNIYRPRSLKVAPDGTAYLICEGPVIRRVTMDGNVEEVALGPAFGNPEALQEVSLAFDAEGRLFALADHTLLTGFPLFDESKLSNLSVLKKVNASPDSLTMGFVLEGTGTKRVLARAVGPSLQDHGVTSGYLADPSLEFHQSGTLVDQNNDWVNEDDLVNASQDLGAFSLRAESKDSAILPSLGPGAFTVTVSALDATGGLALAEVYDASVGALPRLTNLSTLSSVGGEHGTLTVGFVIAGNDAKTVVVRGAGPSLTQFGLSESSVLANPRVRLFSNQEQIAENDDWAGDPLLAAAFAHVGAFGYSSMDSRDAALLLHLDPGVYTVQVDSPDDGSGTAIAEIYEIK